MILLHREEEEVYVNPASIKCISKAAGVGSCVTFLDGSYMVVIEKPEEVVSRMRFV